MTEPQDEAEIMGAAFSFFADLEKEAEKLEQGEFEEFADLVETLPEHKKQYTAVLFAKHQPEKCRRVIFLLAARWGVNRIAKTVKCSDHTVMAIKRRLPEKVAMARDSLAALHEDVVFQQLERLREDPSALDIDKAPLTIKLLTDSLLALRGTAPPPQRHIHEHTVVSHEDVNELIRQAQMGLEGAKALPNGAGLAGAGGSGAGMPVLDVAFEVRGRGLATGDIESLGSVASNRVGPPNDTGLDTDGAAKPGAGAGLAGGLKEGDRGGGGPRAHGGGADDVALPPS